MSVLPHNIVLTGTIYISEGIRARNRRLAPRFVLMRIAISLIVSFLAAAEAEARGDGFDSKESDDEDGTQRKEKKT